MTSQGFSMTLDQVELPPCPPSRVIFYTFISSTCLQPQSVVFPAPWQCPSTFFSEEVEASSINSLSSLLSIPKLLCSFRGPSVFVPPLISSLPFFSGTSFQQLLRQKFLVFYLLLCPELFCSYSIPKYFFLNLPAFQSAILTFYPWLT